MEQVAGRKRRPDLDTAFTHIAALGALTDVSHLSDPRDQWLTAMRGTLSRYGDVGPAPSLDGVSFTPVIANGVSCEWVVADGASSDRRIVYIHGGAWAAGSPLDYRAYSATLARMSGASILMVDYRLAPDHRFPAGLDDCVAALEWAFDNGPQSEAAGRAGRDPAERLILAGDSAGGNLSAATCIRQITTGGRMPDRLVLVAGTLDNVSMPDRMGIDDPICTQESLTGSVHFYLPPGRSAAEPEVSPVYAPEEVLAKFPPTLLQVSTIEALRHDSMKFTDRLERAGVRVTLSLWPDLPHVWHAFLGLFPEATEALQEMADFTRR